jgi:hypothetical protein
VTTLGELMTPLSREDVERTTYELLAAVGFPTTAWGTYSVPRRLISAFSEVVSDLSLWVSWTARGSVLALAEDNGWLDLLGSGWYKETRFEAAQTVGTVELEDHGAGPHTITVGAVVVKADGGELYYRNTTGGTLTLNGTLDVTVAAFEPGEAYNVPGGTIETVTTGPATVTVSNAADWISTSGRERERAVDYVSRCESKWGTLGTGTPALALESMARTAAPGITKVTVRDDNPIGNATAQVVCASGSGPASAADVALVQAAIDPKRAVGSVIEAVAATALTVNVVATLRVEAASRAAAEAQIIQAFSDYQRDLPIGGSAAGILYRSQIVELLMSGDGMIDVDLATLLPSGNTAIGPVEVVAFNLDLSWIEVSG